ncbi:hemagglutinin repeat-containing protein [Actinobacillus pleuropneumoniae]|uniref:two-partner secretion domain-containing protein n=1 Tax=Actinobacillus pleuropneumoniae TaxID=715 RepID=UPI003D06A32D
MNKKSFRVIFSKTLQCLVVVSELARTTGKANEAGMTSGVISQKICKIRPLTFSLFCALGFVGFSENALAELLIQADKNAPKHEQPIVLKTQNGLPQVNIQTPNDKGLSHNKYSRFDVDSKGAILNNSRSQTQTQLAGMVQGNPNLSRGEAKVILNEVNSSDPSILKGYIEVAGKKADVIIANPSGLHCEGCGVINADRATFTTAKPHIQNGSLESFVVEKGKVKVSGKGLDNSRVDYTDIIAKETEINAGVWSKKRLTAVTGKNRVTARTAANTDSDLKIINTVKNSTQAAEESHSPQYALDVSALGGMYAGKVRLIGTEQGLGVRNAGHIGASSENVKIDSQGRIVNQGIVTGYTHAQLSARQGIENQGKLATKQGNIVLTSQADIRQHGSIVVHQGNIRQSAAKGIRQSGETVAKGQISFNAEHIETSESSLIVAGADIQSTQQGETRRLSAQADNGKDIHITVRQQAVLKGKNIASGTLQIKANKANLDKSQISANRIDINAAKDDIQANQAKINAKDSLRLNTSKTLSTEDSHLIAKHIQTAQTDLNTRNSVWEQIGEQDLILNAKSINNQGGAIKTQGKFRIETEQVNNNKGILFTAQLLNINADRISNQQGIMQSSGDMRLSATRLDNQAGVIYSKTAALNIAEINNEEVSDKGSLILATESLVLNSKRLNNQATKAKNEKPTQGIQTNKLTINVDHFDNRKGGVYSGKIISMTGKARLDNRQGELLAIESVDIKDKIGNFVVDNQDGLLQAGNRISLQAKSLINEGAIKTAGDLSIFLKDSFVLNKAFEVGNRLTFKTEGNFENNAKLVVNNQAVIFAQKIQNNKEAEVSSKETALVSKTLLNKGLIDGHKTLIKSDEVTNIGTGRIYGDQLAFKSNALKNFSENLNGEEKSGTIAARSRLDLGVNKLINSNKALVLSLGDAYIGSHLDEHNQAIGKADLIENNSATIEFLGNARVGVKKLINRDTHVKTRIREEKEEFDLYGKEDPITKKVERWYRVGVDGLIDHANGQRHKSATFDFYDPNKQDIVAQKGELWQRKKFTQIKEIAESYDESPAEFLVGGSLFLNSRHTLNQYSKLLIGDKLYFNEQAVNGGTASVQTENGILENKDFTVMLTERKLGEFYRYQQDRRRSGKRKHHKNFFDEKIKSPIDEYTSNESRLNPAINIIGTKLSPIPHSDVTAQSQSGNSQAGNIQLKKTDISYDEDKSGQTNHLISINDKYQIITSGQNLEKNDSGTITSRLVDMTLPNASLYKINPDATQGYIIETDPRFTERRRWLSSGYLLEQLGHNGEGVLKRLGDGFYEQRLVNEQINQLTGRRYLDGYVNDIEQYKALMKNGAKYAKKFNLKVGIGLTAEQMAQLTTDMVWLVNKNITLADGRKVSALVPQVYLSTKGVDIASHSAVIAAKEISGNIASLQNNGVIAGRELTHLNAELLENSGTISGNKIDLSAKQSLVNLAGKIEAVDFLRLSADKKLEIAGTLSDTQSKYGNTERTSLDKTATVSVTGEDGRLILQSNGDLTAKAADITSKGVVIAKAKELNITTANVKNKEHYNGDADNYYLLDQKSEIGSRIKGSNGVTLIAENDAILRLAEVTSQNGKVIVAAKQGDIKVEAGRTEEQLASAVKSTRRGFLNKTTEKQRYAHNISEAAGSNIDGKNVSLIAEQGNISIKGSAAVAENDLTIAAKQDISILADKNTYFRDEKTERKKSGLMGTGGIGFTIGSKKEQVEQDNTQQSTVRSQVGSLNGDSKIFTGNHYRQTGSIVTARDGNVEIQAKSALLEAARSDYESHYKRTAEQKGVTVAINLPIVQAVQSALNLANTVQKVGESKNNRINAMATANVALDAMGSAEQMIDVVKNIKNAQNLAKGVSEGASISVTYANQKQIQTQQSEGSKGVSSRVNAGGMVNIKAIGDSDNSNITVIGANIGGKKGTLFKADGNVNLLAFKQEHKERSTNKSSGFNTGIAASYGNGGFAFGITAGANYGKGYGNRDEATWLNSRIGNKDSLTKIESGRDTKIKGAQVRGNRVEVSAENLNIESTQDVMRYGSKQMAAEGSITAGYGFSANGSYNQSKVNADFASVNEQSGILAGNSGYDINIRKRTDLKGAVITSTEKAEAAGYNRFSTGVLSHQDIQNQSSYSAKGFGLNGGFSIGGGDTSQEVEGMKLQQIGQNHTDGSSKVEFGGVAGVGSQGNWGITKGLATAFLGQVRDSSRQSGITTSFINTANIQIRESEAQKVLTGKTTEETVKLINKANIHQAVTKTDVEQVKSDLGRDLTIATDFVKNLSNRGDRMYYQMEKNEDSLFSIHDEVKNKNCNHISCLGFEDRSFKDNSQTLKRIIYSDQILTDEQAKLLSNVAIAGMLNLERKDKVSSAILYGKTLSSLEETPVILNRGSAGMINEFLFTGFERFRAWANMPAVFGASNATRDHAQINKKLDEYNAYQMAQGKRTIDANNVAHSLGVSGNKNMLNWSEYVGNKYDNTHINFSHLGGSYPSSEIHKQAKGVFKGVNTEYHGVKGDFVYSGLGGLFIGNNPNAKQVEELDFRISHSVANQNIRNIKYIDTDFDRIKEKEDFLKFIYPYRNGIRQFEYLGESK